MKAIQVTEFGGPEVLTLADVDEPQPFEGGAVVDVSAAGINYADTHAGRELLPVRDRAADDPRRARWSASAPTDKRVVALIADGGYAEKAVVAQQASWQVPDGVADGEALSIVLQGITAWHLLRTSAKMSEGETVVVHAAAGGVGTIAVQLAKRWGAGRVIATASSDEKRALAIELGADVAIDSQPGELEAGARRGERRPQGRCRAGDDGRPGVRRKPRGAGAVRPAGHLRHGEPSSCPSRSTRAR